MGLLKIYYLIICQVKPANVCSYDNRMRRGGGRGWQHTSLTMGSILSCFYFWPGALSSKLTLSKQLEVICNWRFTTLKFTQTGQL